MLWTSLSKLPSREDCVEDMIGQYRSHVIVIVRMFRRVGIVLRDTVLVFGKAKSILQCLNWEDLLRQAQKAKQDGSAWLALAFICLRIFD